MFEKLKAEKGLKFVNGYLEINNNIYRDEIKEEFDEFDKVMNELVVKNIAGYPGFEKYTPRYFYLKRIEFLAKLFKEYSAMDIWSQRLKGYLKQSDKRIVSESGMTLGSDPKRLSPTEIILNEENAKKTLANLNLIKSTLESQGVKFKRG